MKLCGKANILNFVIIAFVILFSCTLYTEENKNIFPWSLSMTNLRGENISFEQLKGNILLITNIPTRCSFAPHLQDLENLYQLFKEKNFIILAFLSEDFIQREVTFPVSIQHITTFGNKISFPIFQQLSTRGKEIHPLYKWLTDPNIQGLFGGKIIWNFTKFLIDQEGQVIGRFSPFTSALDSSVIDAIHSCLNSE